MRAVIITRPGGPEVLELRDDVPVPEIGKDDVRVQVHATAVNRADLLQRQGHYPPPPGVPAHIPGLEYAGIVAETGEHVRRWSGGERVMGLVAGGSYAEFVAVNQAELLPVPDRLPLVEAAAVPEAFLTAHDALFTLANLSAGESVLIHGVGSGVGTAAAQLAAAHGARVFGTSRSAWKLERALTLGVDIAINTAVDDFAAVVLRETDGRGVNVVIDLVGGDVLRGNVSVLASLGRLIIVGLVAGGKAELDMRLVLRKRLTIRGTVMRTRSQPERAAVVDAFQRDAMPLLESGQLQPVIHGVLDLRDAARAHELVQNNENFGKVILRVSTE